MQNSTENFILTVNKPDMDFVGKSEFQFSNNNMVNSDFIEYLKFLTTGDYLSLGFLMKKMHNKTRIFYMAEDYDTFNSLVTAYTKIRNFYFKWTTPLSKTPRLVNEYTLSLVLIDTIGDIANNIVYVSIKDNIYRFSSGELLSIYKFSLNSVDATFYLEQKLIPPKNPYTNIAFTLRENLILFKQLKDYLFTLRKCVPSFLMQFKECYFNLKFYTRLNINRLSLISINKYVDEMSRDDFLAEFNEMRENRTIRGIYCKYCYKRTDLYSIFKKTVTKYLLNSNGIYIFGHYIRDFMKMAKLNKLIFDSAHRHYHEIKKRNSRKKAKITYKRRLTCESVNILSSYATNNTPADLNLTPHQMPPTSTNNDRIINDYSNGYISTGDISRDNTSDTESSDSIHDDIINNWVSQVVSEFTDTSTAGELVNYATIEEKVEDIRITTPMVDTAIDPVEIDCVVNSLDTMSTQPDDP